MFLNLTYFLSLASIALQIIISVFILYRLLSWRQVKDFPGIMSIPRSNIASRSSLIGFGLMVLFLPVPTYVGRLIQGVQHEKMRMVSLPQNPSSSLLTIYFVPSRRISASKLSHRVCQNSLSCTVIPHPLSAFNRFECSPNAQVVFLGEIHARGTRSASFWRTQANARRETPWPSL